MARGLFRGGRRWARFLAFLLRGGGKGGEAWTCGGGRRDWDGGREDRGFGMEMEMGQVFINERGAVFDLSTKRHVVDGEICRSVEGYY